MRGHPGELLNEKETSWGGLSTPYKCPYSNSTSKAQEKKRKPTSPGRFRISREGAQMEEMTNTAPRNLDFGRY